MPHHRAIFGCTGRRGIYKIGLVADVNAIIFGVALALFLTSRQSFRDAERSTLTQGWEALILDNPSSACCTGTQKRLEHAYFCQKMHISCFRGEGQTEAIEVLANPPEPGYTEGPYIEKELIPILRDLDSCGGVGEWALDPRPENFTQKGAVDALEKFSDAGQNLLQMITLYPDPAQHPQLPIGKNPCPPSLSGMVRVDTQNQHTAFYFRLKSMNDTQVKSCFADKFVQQSQGHNALGIHLRDRSLACPPVMNNSTVGECDIDGIGVPRITFPWCFRYECVDGVNNLKISDLNDEVTVARRGQKFSYFWCMSYDELFGSYISFLALAAAVILSTFVLLVIKIVYAFHGIPARDWSSMPQADDSGDNLEADDAGGKHQADADDSCMSHVKKWTMVTMRCIGSIAIGVIISMLFVYMPWVLSKNASWCSR